MNWDALFMMLGMMIGAYFFAEASDWLSRTVDKVGDFGKIRFPDLVRLRPATVTLGMALLLIVGLMALEMIERR
jgi:uncharacterized protein